MYSGLRISAADTGLPKHARRRPADWRLGYAPTVPFLANSFGTNRQPAREDRASARALLFATKESSVSFGSFQVRWRLL